MKKKCINCGHDQYEEYKLDFSVYMCKKCKLYSCNDAKFNSNFESTLVESSRVLALKNLRIRNYEKIILKIKNLGCKHGLEIGSSYGWFLDFAKENNIACSGVEPEKKSYDKAILKGHVVKNGFYPEVELKDKYDFIIFNDVLEHIPNLDDVMTANYSNLKTDGILIINIPISTGIFFYIARVLYLFGIKSLFNRLWQFNFHSPHYYYFNRNNLINFAEKYNFEVIDSHRLDVVDFSNLEERFKMNGKINFLDKVLINFSKLKINKLILNKLPSDIVCFYFKKNNSNV